MYLCRLRSFSQETLTLGVEAIRIDDAADLGVGDIALMMVAAVARPVRCDDRMRRRSPVQRRGGAVLAAVVL